jgi:K+-transporting ATPase ATPase C chain
MASGGTNLGPNSPVLLRSIESARAQVARENGVSASDVPPDAVTSSASGLDPDISPAYADIQVARVARARDMSVADVQRLVDEHTQGRVLGFLGEPRVDVLELNLALAQAGR